MTDDNVFSELNLLKQDYDKLNETEFEHKKVINTLNILYDALNSTVGGIILTDLDGIIVFSNPSFLKLFGYDSSDDIVGKKAADIFTDDEIKTMDDLLSIINITKNNIEEFVVRKKDGETFFVEVSSSHVKNKNGSVAGYMVSFVNISKRKQALKEKDDTILELQHALEKIKTLKGLIPICASCKKIRDDKGFWHQVENYVSSHSDAQFSHGICPDCARKLYPEFFNNLDDEDEKS